MVHRSDRRPIAWSIRSRWQSASRVPLKHRTGTWICSRCASRSFSGRPEKLRDAHLEQIQVPVLCLDRKSTRLNSSHSQISYAVFCLKKKKTRNLVCTQDTNDGKCKYCLHTIFEEMNSELLSERGGGLRILRSERRELINIVVQRRL